MKRYYADTILLITFSLIMCGCNNRSGEMKKNQGQTVKESKEIKQSKKDLLAGTSSALCYSGFRTGQHPDRGDGARNPSREEILEDLILIQDSAGFGLIRLYDSGENSEAVLGLIEENDLDIKVMLGIWLNAELSNHESCAWLTEPIPDAILKANKKLNMAEIERGISLANRYPGIVVALNVGNEALVDWNDHKVDVDTLITYVRKVKVSVNQPVTVAENYEWWAAKGKKLASELDFIAVHVYPVWEGKDIDEGLSYSIDNIKRVADSLPESKIVISEAGWASVASEFGERASEAKQLQYYNDFMSWTKSMNITTFFFEAFDEDWKGDPNDPYGAEKHWGLFSVDREPKLAMKEIISQRKKSIKP